MAFGSKLVIALALALLVSFVAAPIAAALDASNLYYDDVKTAERRLESAQTRLGAAQAEQVENQALMPGLRADLVRWTAAEKRRVKRSDRADGIAQRAQDRVEAARRAAFLEAEAVRERQQQAETRWREDRSRSISIAWLIVALLGAAGIGLVAHTMRGRRVARSDIKDADSDGRMERTLALLLGGLVAGYLAGLVSSLWAADAVVVNAWVVAAAAAVVLLPVGLIAGWRRPGDTSTEAIRVPAWAGATVAAIAVVAVLVAGLADPRPEAQALPRSTMAMAAAYATKAPMPPRVQRKLDLAARRRTQLNTAKSKQDTASSQLDAVLTTEDRLNRRVVRLQNSISHWSGELQDAQQRYDHWTSLTDESPSSTVPDVPLPDSTVPSVPSVPPGGGGTTEDFGSGTGSVGYCADGTLSDSIGRPGACSHHGGVG